MDASDKRLVLKSTWTSNALTTSTTVVGCFVAIFAILQFVPPVMLNEFICNVLSRAWFQIVEPMSGTKLNLIVSAVASLIGAPVMCVTTYAVFGKFSDGSLQLTEQRINFPMKFALPLRFRLSRTWKDLKEFELVPANFAKLQLDDKLRLSFHSGGSITIGKSQLSEMDLLCLVDSVDEMATDCLVPARLLSARRETIEKMPEPPPAGTRSITELWDDDYARKYRSTAFVPLEPGDFLQNNRIRIIRQLASTALSSTYLARLSEKKLVVLKESVVPLDSSVGKKAHQLFERECEMLLKLDHPGIARVVDQFVEGGRSYLAIEFVVGMDLRKHIATVGKQDSETVITWLTQLCDILEYLHSREPAVLHRDVTPENLVLSDDEKIHLIDFGAANQLVENATGTLIGKQSYIAPEQLRGKAAIQSDIYSAGATAYFLLTGKDPEPLSECHPRHLDYAVPVLLDELVARCTAPESSQRPESAAQLKRLLAECRMFAASKTA